MQRIPIFDGQIFKFECGDSTLYSSLQFSSFVNDFFQNPALKNHKAAEQVGNVQTSVGVNDSEKWSDPGLRALLKWASREIGGVKADFKKEVCSRIEIRRIWFNRMLQHSKGLLHSHDSEGVDGVAIFYISVPDNSGDLVFAEDSSFQNTFCANVATGLLLVHTPQLLHAITEHKSPEPRTVMVFEFRFV